MTLSKRQQAAVRTGQLVRTGNHFKVRLSFVDGTRPWIHLPPGLSEEEARQRAAALAKKAISEGWTRAVQGQARGRGDERADVSTVASWFSEYFRYKESRGQTVNAPKSHARAWIVPFLGDKRMVAVTPDDLRGFVAVLDRAVAHDELRWKSATNIWGTATKAFKDAANCKYDELRILPSNPALGIPPPDKGRQTAKVHLFPSEFLALMTCEQLPLVRRRAYAVAVYLYLRPGEVEALDWVDFDLAHEQVTIQRSIDRELGGDKAPKNGMARVPMSIEPTLLPLIRAMRREDPSAHRVFADLGNERDFASGLRADLLLAGVDRHELHHWSKNPPRDWMTMHDLRTTGITWMAVRGDPLLIVKTRAGHSDIKMTAHYINMAAMMRQARYGEVFPPLPQVLLGPSAMSVDVRSLPSPARSERAVEPADDLDDGDVHNTGSEPRVAAARVLH
ncbi:MAG: tyrosine-type recombinase/integrase [Polyangiales bacterium]